jgi:SAM-dependent methyltransferase
VLLAPLKGGSLYECKSCYLYFRYPRLPKAQLDILYQESSLSNWQYKPGDRRDWEIAANWLNERVVGKTVLDIGCFDGSFGKHLEPSWEKYGVEINEAAVKRAEERGIHIICRDLSEFDSLSTQFDAVTAFDVIEHVEDPKAFVEKIVKVTCPGGTIIISTGNTNAISWRFMGSRYWYCAIGEHISFINKQWCYDVAKALNCRVQHFEQFSHLGKNRTLSWMLLDLTKNVFYKFSPRVFNWLRSIRSIYLDKTDTSKYREFRQCPPGWESAKDHLVVIFRKP